MISKNEVLLEKKRQGEVLVKKYSQVKKYAKLLETVSGRSKSETFAKRAMVAQLFDNQRADALKTALNESTLTTNIAGINRYLIPIIHRVFPTLPINDLVGIQPLTGPTGQIFTAEMKYTNNKAPQTAAETIYDNASQTYASQTVDGEVFQAAGSSTTAYAGTLGWKPIVPSTLTVTIGATTGVDDGSGAITGSGIASGTINYTTGAIAVTLSVASTSAGSVVYQYNSEANTQIPEVELSITSQSVTAKSRKLRAKYSPEALQDLQALHGVDGEAMFLEIFANEIQREISRNVVELLRAAVPSTAKKSWNQTRPDYISFDEHKRTIIDALVILSDQYIYPATRRGKGNVLVTGTEASSIITTLPGFVADSGAAITLPSGRFGVLNQRWVVLNDIDMAVDKVLIAYKGDTFMDTGFVYSPYVALQLAPLMNPDDFEIRTGFMTRDALTTINGKFYAELSITGDQVIS